MPNKVVRWKALVLELFTFQVLPSFGTTFVLVIIRLLDRISHGLSSKIIWGSPIYLWVLSTILATQIVMGGYTLAMKIRNELPILMDTTMKKMEGRLNEISETYEMIVSSWKKTFSTNLLMDLLKENKNQRTKFYRLIDQRFLPKNDDLNGPVVIKEVQNDSDVLDLSTGSTTAIQKYQKMLDLKEKLRK